ncbi:MAG: endonuclease/exonuclease/phosphatase family protein, partial [Neomegalonema sp.]|nr:endonuclease/exonuclease/phosphatase family protein [Neomegalonema sp.]
MRAALLVLCAVMAALFAASPVAAELVAKREGAVRIATFNIHLARGKAGKLIAELRGGKSAQVDALAEILQRVRPDIILLQELDWDRSGTALALFEAELARGRRGLKGLSYGYRLQPPVNTGERSGLDLDRDGKRYGPGDAYGWGLFPGQFGFVILSRFPIEVDAARTFRLLRWAETPMARLRPKRPDGGWFHPDAIWASMRLSSKTHLDAPIRLPSGQTLHLLASHPTPPVFDGPEDRNGRRAAAEILFWKHYLAGADWIRDDQGRTGGLKKDALFVIAGDQNTDPADGDGRHDAIAALLRDPRIADPAPKSAGAVAASKAQGGV